MNLLSKFIGKTLDSIVNQTRDRMIKNNEKRRNTPGTKEYENDQYLQKRLKKIRKEKAEIDAMIKKYSGKK
jgi:transcription termination factor NusB